MHTIKNILKVEVHYIFSIILIFLSLPSFTGCSDDDSGFSAEQQRINELTATWNVDQVRNDNNNVTDQFTGFTLTVTSEQNFATLNGGNAWPSSGSWTFNGDNLEELLRNDEVIVTIVKVSKSELDLRFAINTLPGGRTSGVTGQFFFELNKQN
mgnify:CR=1 FL=1